MFACRLATLPHYNLSVIDALAHITWMWMATTMMDKCCKDFVAFVLTKNHRLRIYDTLILTHNRKKQLNKRQSQQKEKSITDLKLISFNIKRPDGKNPEQQQCCLAHTVVVFFSVDIYRLPKSKYICMHIHVHGTYFVISPLHTYRHIHTHTLMQWILAQYSLAMCFRYKYAQPFPNTFTRTHTQPSVFQEERLPQFTFGTRPIVLGSHICLHCSLFSVLGARYIGVGVYVCAMVSKD